MWRLYDEYNIIPIRFNMFKRSKHSFTVMYIKKNTLLEKPNVYCYFVLNN